MFFHGGIVVSPHDRCELSVRQRTVSSMIYLRRSLLNMTTTVYFEDLYFCTYMKQSEKRVSIQKDVKTMHDVNRAVNFL